MVRRIKEDRQERKKTKYGLESEQLRSGGNAVSQKSSNAELVFSKNSYASLVLRGKAKQRQLKQQALQDAARSTASSSSIGMEEDDAPVSLSAALTKMAGAAAKNNNYEDELQLDLQDLSSPAQLLDPTITGKRDSSIKAYMKELRKVVDNADVLLEVLDARDPLGCRSLETETMLLRAGKKVVLILNKIDLVPKANVEAWLKHLRHDFPTLAFKASTQSQRTNLSQGASSVYSKAGSSGSGREANTIQGGSEAIGAGALLQLIKNYSRNLNLKTSIAVGIFGAPNVGKSSVINSLKRARVCSVASTPGHTKVVQSVMLDKSVRLLDSPGIVFSDESTAGAQALGLSPEEILQRKQSALLRNVVKVELVQDPVTPVEAIMARVDPEHLQQVYGLEYFQPGNAQDLLMRIAINRGRLGRGGKIDIDSTARSVLHDWNIGRIKYYTQPPALHRSAVLSANRHQTAEKPSSTGTDDSSSHLQKNLEQTTAIVSGFSESFDLAALMGEADAQVFGLDGTSGGSGFASNLTDAPATRYAEAEASQEAESIVDDHEPTEPLGDTSRQSTLGKRSRAFDSDTESDNGMSDDDQMSDLGAIEEEAVVQDNGVKPPQQAAFTFQSPTVASGRSKRDAELATAFSISEMSHMAVPTSTQRQKLKKLKKRAQRSTAGLAGIFEQDAALGDDADLFESPEKNRASIPGKGMTGMFGALPPTAQATTKSKKGKNSKKTPVKIGGMFDILMEQDDELDDEEEAATETAPSRTSIVQREEYEEEL